MALNPALKSELENLFTVVPQRSSREELVIVCPEPSCGDKTGNRAVNLKTGMTNCWRCNIAGHVVTWARKLGYTFEANIQTAAIGTIIEDLNDVTDRPSNLPSIQAIKLPAGFTPIQNDPEGYRCRQIAKMAVRKNLTFDDFVSVGAGFTRVDPKWDPFCIFPVMEYDTAVYFQGRTYIDKPGESTKLFPSRSEVRYGARYWVYGIDEVRRSKARIVIVVESILNVLSLRKKLAELGWLPEVVPICVFKHRVSTQQAEKINRCASVKEVCLMFDHDATKNAWQPVAGLSNRIVATVAAMPKGEGNSKLDPNDDVETAIRSFENRIEYSVGKSIEYALAEETEPKFFIGGSRLRSIKA